MKQQRFRFRAMAAVVAAAVGSSLIGLAVMIIAGQFAATGNNDWMAKPLDLLVVTAIALIWAPAFAFIPAALLGYFVERPKARWMIANHGGIAAHLTLSVLAAVVLSILFRIGLRLFDPHKSLVDPFSLGLFAIIGLGSGLAWWFIVIVPGKRA